MKVRFYLERHKGIKSKKRAIRCYIREYSFTLAINTGQSIDPDLWDKSSQRANPKKVKDKILGGELKSLNMYLNGIESKIYEIERSIRSKDFKTGFSVISEKIREHFNKREIGFYDIYDEFLKYRKIKVTKESFQKYKRTRTFLSEFEKYSKDKISFEKINPLFFEKYFTFLIDNKGQLNNTAHKNIKFLKTFLIWANSNNFTDNQSYKSFKSISEQNEIIYITEDELMSLYNFETNIERLERVRDIFVFQCFTGVRFSDMQNLKHEDIIGSNWKLRTKKTHDIIDIPLNAYALSILAKYENWTTPLPPISNQKMNLYLKELCKVAGVDTSVKIIKYKGSNRIEKVYKKYEVIGSHTARRTFISLSLEKGMKPDVIMAITGHRSYRMMQRYLKIADKHKKEEMEKVWGSTLKLVE